MKRGRKPIDGEEVRCKLPADVRLYVKQQGGSKWLATVLRAIMVNDKQKGVSDD